MKLPLLVGLPAVLLACASAPPVRHPDPPGRPAASATSGRAFGEVEGHSWWDSLEAPQLDSLIAAALAHNFDLQAAAARLDMARARARIAGASKQPQLTAGATASRRKQNFVGLPIPGGANQVLTSTTNTYGVSLDLGWEVDLWGRLRAGEAAALADVQAAAADLRGARLSLAAHTARLYFAIVESDRQVALAGATVDNYRLSTEQIEARYRSGLRSSLDLHLGRSSLAAAEALLQQRRQQRDQLGRQLELLLGSYPAAPIAARTEMPSVPACAPVGLPADLVARRPDLAAAERRLAAADRRLAEARATLYPRISLTASGGRSSADLSDLLDGDFGVWALLANMTQPLLQGGRLRGGVDLARAGRDQAIALYAQSVLRAYAEVESSLAAEQFLAGQETALARATEEALAARRLAEDRYNKGLADLITLLEAQRRAFEAESRLLAVRRLRLDARIDLHLALGGGFAATDTTTARSEI